MVIRLGTLLFRPGHYKQVTILVDHQHKRCKQTKVPKLLRAREREPASEIFCVNYEDVSRGSRKRTE